MSMTYQDYFIPNVMSDCCSASVVITGMCSECYEHCECPNCGGLVQWDCTCILKEDDDEMSSMQQTA